MIRTLSDEKTFFYSYIQPCFHLRHRQSRYRQVLRWDIFIEQELRFGLDLVGITEKKWARIELHF